MDRNREALVPDHEGLLTDREGLWRTRSGVDSLSRPEREEAFPVDSDRDYAKTNSLSSAAGSVPGCAESRDGALDSLSGAEGTLLSVVEV
jgi:hypothetical protein